uniref:Uncharacterized protein MANES_14G117100 n=1 Tax=Rhizophora mucronata TaxID=61149 RepID=A0A2P2LPR8_RHIMU
MCCGFLCPCFYAKRKANAHSFAANDPNSMHSVPSFGANSPAEKAPSSPYRVPPSPYRFSHSPKLSRLGSVNLTLSQVTKATSNFSPSLRIGEGGFGTVFKVQLEDGQVVAIKRAKKVSIAFLCNFKHNGAIAEGNMLLKFWKTRNGGINVCSSTGFITV